MSVSNLSIVFGPTLLGAPPEMGAMNLEHMSFQCKVSRNVALLVFSKADKPTQSRP